MIFKRYFSASLLVMALGFFLTGCDGTQQVTMDKIRVFRGSGQCALPGKPFAQPLLVELSGKPSTGWFGGGRRPSAFGSKVIFEVEQDSDLLISAREGIADHGGLVKVFVTAGRKIGDQYLKIIPVDAPSKAISVRFTTGIEISGVSQEARSGNILSEPMTVKLVQENGAPAAGVPVFFNLMSSPSGKDSGKLVHEMVVTDIDGEAKNNLKMGDGTGHYEINVEVGGAGNAMFARGITVQQLGVNFYMLFITIFGGLAIFVFGMKMMGDGLQKAAGNRMRGILHFFSSNRYMALVAGALVTAVVQSSSASTVMVIGFVNAGLLNLMQAIGIIFGANIGTTITAQIIAFDVSKLSLPAIIIGLLMLFCTWKLLSGWGETIMGFGLLFFGMVMMGNSLKLIADFPSFVSFFRSFDCAPVEGGFMPFGSLLGAIGIGMGVTMVLQSSSATTGIILALGASGLLNLYTAIPLIMGSNIGTTITALLASLPTNRISKQAAVAHTVFNVFGVLLFTLLLYVRWSDSGVPAFLFLIDKITAGDAFAAVPQNLPRHIANAHTLFNVITALVMVPAIPLVARFCEWVLPLKKEKVKYQYLEPYLLDTPVVALEQSVRSLCYMVKESWRMIDQAVNVHFINSYVDEEKFKDLDDREERIDQLQAEITNYLVQITRRELTEPQSEIIPLLMHCTNDAERVADHTANIMALTVRLKNADGNLSEKGRNDLQQMCGYLGSLALNVIAALESSNQEYISQALDLENQVNRLANELEANHIERLRAGLCDAIVGVIYIELIGELEKVADHLTNIAERAKSIQMHYLDLGWEHFSQTEILGEIKA